MPKPFTMAHIADKFFTTLNNLLQKLSLASLYRLGTIMGHLFWYLLPSRRRETIARVQKHLPQRITSKEQAKQLAHKSMCENGRAFMELFATHRFGLHSINHQVHVAEPDLYTRFTTCERPVVAITAHIGSWEIMSALFGIVFPQDTPRAVITRRQSFEALQKVIDRQRSTTGVQIIYHHRAASHVLRVLKQNGIIAILADHNAKENEAIFLPFLNEIAAVNRGPALLAIRAKAIIWPACLVRNYDETYTHTFHTYEPLDTTTLQGTIDEQILETATFITKSLERMVLAYPEQWLWMHNRWKTRPPE